MHAVQKQVHHLQLCMTTTRDCLHVKQLVLGVNSQSQHKSWPYTPAHHLTVATAIALPNAPQDNDRTLHGLVVR